MVSMENSNQGENNSPELLRIRYRIDQAAKLLGMDIEDLLDWAAQGKISVEANGFILAQEDPDWFIVPAKAISHAIASLVPNTDIWSHQFNIEYYIDTEGKTHKAGFRYDGYDEYIGVYDRISDVDHQAIGKLFIPRTEIERLGLKRKPQEQEQETPTFQANADCTRIIVDGVEIKITPRQAIAIRYLDELLDEPDDRSVRLKRPLLISR